MIFMLYISHPLVKPETMQAREYQIAITEKSKNKHLLCVLPTGVGKTNIAILLAAHRLEENPESRILVMAPTKPLVTQHYRTFKKFLDIEPKDFVAVTGETKAYNRKHLYKMKRLIFATPQTIQSDLNSGILSLKEFSLLVFDEAHRSIGGYAYPFIAKNYLSEASDPRILALTASPGGTQQKIDQICRNLGIEAVDIRTEKDLDVKEYVKEKKLEWIYVDLPKSFQEIIELLKQVYSKKLSSLRRMGYSKPKQYISKKDLLELQRTASATKSYGISTTTAQAIKLEHAIGLLESQGISPFLTYMKKLSNDKTRAAKSIMKDKKTLEALSKATELSERGSRHPKIAKLCSIVHQELDSNPGTRIIVFANFRDTVSDIVLALKGIEKAEPIEFIGQRSVTGRHSGLSQKEQARRIQNFSDGLNNILVSTSVGEEGIDISEANLAIFYEPVPSEIRTIQRRGRVGRTEIGRVAFLVAKDTRDEAYRWVAHRKEKQMHKTLRDLQGPKQSYLDKFGK